MFPAIVFAGSKRPKAGKYSFSEDQRIEIFSFIIDEIRKHSEIPIAVCKESSEVWTRLGLDMTKCQCVCQFDRFDLKAEREDKMLEPNTDPPAADEKEIAELSEMDDDNLIFDDDPAIHAAIKFMRGKIKSKFLATSLEIGNYVLKKFFHDNPSEASDRNRAKNTSFRKLCENQYLPLSKTHLNLMVRIAVQDRIFEKKGISKDAEGLTYSHLCEVAKLPSVEAKRSIVAEIKKNKLSVRQTADRVKEIKGKEPEPEVHILTDGQLQGLRDLLGEYMSFALDMELNLPEPSAEKWAELASNVKQTLQELTTVRAMFRELDAHLTVLTSGQSEKELDE
jgi:hypothetical protein